MRSTATLLALSHEIEAKAWRNPQRINLILKAPIYEHTLVQPDRLYTLYKALKEQPLKEIKRGRPPHPRRAGACRRETRRCCRCRCLSSHELPQDAPLPKRQCSPHSSRLRKSPECVLTNLKGFTDSESAQRLRKALYRSSKGHCKQGYYEP